MPHRRRALVAGGSGFLGSHVADHLSRKGWAVTIFDRRASPYLSTGQRMVVGDVLDLRAVAAAIRGHDAVLHFAGVADIEEANRDPLAAVRTNVMGTAHLLEAARAARVRRFVFASSIYAYSASGGIYRTTKLSCERLVEDYGERFRLGFTILRFGSIYGPRADARNGVYQMVRQALERGRIVRRGSPRDVREFLHVEDAAAGAVEALHARYRGTCLMVAGRDRLTVGEFVRLLENVLRRRLRYVRRLPFVDEHYGETPFRFQPRLGVRLQLPVQIDLGEGLLHYVDEVHESLGRPSRR